MTNAAKVPEGYYVEKNPANMSAAALDAGAVEELKPIPEKQYMPWAYAGGPNECAHGYAAGIPCLDCEAEEAKKIVQQTYPDAHWVEASGHIYRCGNQQDRGTAFEDHKLGPLATHKDERRAWILAKDKLPPESSPAGETASEPATPMRRAISLIESLVSDPKQNGESWGAKNGVSWVGVRAQDLRDILELLQAQPTPQAAAPAPSPDLPAGDVTQDDLATAIGWMRQAKSDSGVLQVFAERLAVRERQLREALSDSMHCPGCGSCVRCFRSSGCTNLWHELAAPAAVPDKQTAIDISNLRFYVRMARENEWNAPAIHWSVVEHTCNFIADRLERQLSEALEKIAELEAERSRDVIAVTNCDKLAVARETRTHWQTRAESAEAKLQEVAQILTEQDKDPYYNAFSMLRRIRRVLDK